MILAVDERGKDQRSRTSEQDVPLIERLDKKPTDISLPSSPKSVAQVRSTCPGKVKSRGTRWAVCSLLWELKRKGREWTREEMESERA